MANRFLNDVDINGAVQVSGGNFVDSTRRNIRLNSFSGGGGDGIFFRDGFAYNASITTEDHNGSSADGICISGYDGVSFSTGSNSRNERMRVTSAGNVGIGTTSPRGKLDIVGNTDDDTDFLTIQDNDTSVGSHRPSIRFRSNTAQIGQIVSLDDSMRFSVGTTEDSLLEITGSGKVGIGTAIPVGKLYVGPTWGTTHGGNDLYIKSTGTDNSSYDPQVANTSDLGITYVTTSTNTSGPDKVGLTLFNNDNTAGTFSPMLLFAKREVPSSPYKATMAGIYARSPLGTGNNTSWIDGELIFATAGAASEGIKQRMVINKEGNVGIGTNSPGAKLDVRGDGADFFLQSNDFKIARIQPRGTGANLDKGLFSLFNGNTESLRLDTDGNSWFNGGNVGIGTTSPGVKLDVGGDIQSTGYIYAAGALRVPYAASSKRPMVVLNGATNYGLFHTEGSPDTFSFEHNGVATQTFYGNGNATFTGDLTVGNNLIVNGTTTTLNTQTVEVEDNILQLNTTQGTPDTATAATSGISVYRGNGVTQASLVFDEADDTWDLTNSLAVAGNVGIGTTSPTTKLDILGTSDTYLTIRNTGGGHKAGIRMYGGSAGVSNIWQDDTETNPPGIHFGTSADIATAPTTQLYIKGSDGNVGIGTTSPRSILEAKGNVSIFDPTNYLSDGDTLNGLHFYTDEFSYNPPAGRASTPISKIVPVIDSSGTDSFGLSFYTSGTDAASSEKFRISSDGLVGIGTTSPQYELEVSGTGQVTSRIISTNNQGARFDLHSSGGVGGRYSQQALANGDFFMYDEKNSHTIQRYYDGASGAWVWFTAGTEKMRITSTGAIDFGGAGFGTSGQLLTSNANGSPTWQDAPASGAETVTVTGSTGSRTTTIVEGLNLAGVENLGMPTTGGYTVMGISNGSGSVAAGTVVSFHDSDTTENDDPFAVDLRSNGDYFWNMHGRLTIEETNQNRGGDLEVENNIGWGGDLSGAGASGQQLVGMSNGDSISGASVHIGASGKVHLHGSSGSYNLEIHQTGAAAIELNAFTGELQVAGAGITPGTDASPNALGVGADGRLQTVNVGYTPLAVTKNGSNQFPVVFANAENFSLSCAGTWTIAPTIASGDIGKTGTIIITNTATTTPGSLPSTFKTPNGESIVFQTDSGDVSILSYLVVSTSIVLVNYVGNFS
jgi:hypothetical protein